LKKKGLHIILAYILLIVFQLPMLIQLEHITHDHETHHETCEGHDTENHIHTGFDDSCLGIHLLVNPILQLVISEYKELNSTCFNDKPEKLVVFAFKQLIRYVSLRGPPKSTIA